MLITSLRNLSQPLIRYELTDRFIRPQVTPVASWLSASIDGRTDEVFRYRTVAVHPHVIRSILARESAVLEYQVRQTGSGIDVTCVAGGPLAAAALAARLELALGQAGLTAPRARIRLAKAIPRDSRTGKVSRFIPRQTQPAP
jgi:phenylacetate-coenzyme A ligase PaaK-like adenylate-forming protein